MAARTGHTVVAPVGIVDVAARAGVSPSTVSRVLRGAGGVSAGTRERVLAAAAALDYVPSPAAAGLASGRTRAVGILAPFATRWFFSEVIRGAESALRDAGYDMLLYNVGDAASRERFFATMPLRRRVDAALVVATAFGAAERSALTAVRVPVVGVGGRGTGFPRVGIDDAAGAESAVRHLLALGHRDVVMVSAEPEDPIGRETTLARRAGFVRALRAAGVEPGPGSVVARPWGVAGGVRAMEELLTRPELPTAVFAECDEMALGALQVLRRTGLDVPGRLSLVGFDDHDMALVGDLTTIAQPAHEQGRLAAEQLLAMLAGRPAGGAELPTRLVVRGTTAPPRPG